MKVSEIMSVYIHTVELEDSLELIKDVLADVEYHHLLVEKNEKLVGIISDRDVLSASSPFWGTDQERDIDRVLLAKTAADIMTPNPITIHSSATISEAASLLLKHTISCLPVVKEDAAMEGVITWKDIIRSQLR